MAKTKTPKAPLQVPFDKDGNHMTYVYHKYPEVVPPDAPSYAYYDRAVSWKENYEFSATLKFKYISTGRSAVNGIFEDETTGKKYSTFMSEFQSWIPDLVGGRITGKFTFEKRGQNYGLCMVAE